MAGLERGVWGSGFGALGFLGDRAEPGCKKGRGF